MHIVEAFLTGFFLGVATAGYFWWRYHLKVMQKIQDAKTAARYITR